MMTPRSQAESSPGSPSGKFLSRITNDSDVRDTFFHREIELERKELRRSRYRLWRITCFAIVVNIVIHELYASSKLMKGQYDSITDSAAGFAPADSRANIIYGHLHIPKTGGTTLNGLMAAKYERVCGNKGYSFDAYQANIRAFEGGTKEFVKKGSGNAWDYPSVKIGYENCDYISNVIKWDFWPKTLQKLNAASMPSKSIVEQARKNNESSIVVQPAPQNRKNNLRISQPRDGLKLELHVPCRDPIDHLLSMANHEGSIIKRVVFNCTGVETDDALLEQEVERAYFDLNRFHQGWVNPKKPKNIRLRCFQSIPIEPYVAYMDRFLQTRRIPSEYYHHATNDKRDKSKECVRSLPAHVQDKIRKILWRNHPYMRFCKMCMGTRMQLPL